MSVASQIESINAALPEGTRLVAVSKFHPAEAVQEAYNAGQRIFGESRVQELLSKASVLPSDIEWHFIGHLQTNKIRQILPFVSLIHGADSLRLLQEINKEAQKINRKIPCLLQIHIAAEDTKFGFSPDECQKLAEEGAFNNLEFIQLSGLMGMASLTDNFNQIDQEFKTLKLLFDRLSQGAFRSNKHFSELSMGMSDDYPVALENGSTLIRIGTRIFGQRNY